MTELIITKVLVCMDLVGWLIFLAFGVYLYLRDRKMEKKRKKEEEEDKWGTW